MQGLPGGGTDDVRRLVQRVAGADAELPQDLSYIEYPHFLNFIESDFNSAYDYTKTNQVCAAFSLRPLSLAIDVSVQWRRRCGKI